MARYVATADVTVDGLTFPRGSVLNVPTSVLALNSEANFDAAIPRVRPAGLEFLPDSYQVVATADRIGIQTSTGTFPTGPNVIPEPRLPAANTQYD